MIHLLIMLLSLSSFEPFEESYDVIPTPNDFSLVEIIDFFDED